MSIRSEAIIYRGDLSHQLQDLLRRNGMRAQLAVEDGQYKLIVQGHDSPMLEYSINERQFRALAEGGTNYSNKKAYNTFNGIVGNDFSLPSSYVAARNVNGRVAMGLHGYREEPMMYRHAFGSRFLGWTPRIQDGFHLRRIGGVAMAPMIMEHHDGRIRPGELRSGSYGYYYKGQQPEIKIQTDDPLKEMKINFPPIETKARSTEPAKSYRDTITSDVYFTNEKWQEVLSTHGIEIDPENRTLTIQSIGIKQDFIYDLSQEEVNVLTENSLKTNPVESRISLINEIIKGDFKDPLTKEMLDEKEQISITLHPNVEQTIQAKADRSLNTRQVQDFTAISDPMKGYVDGSHVKDYNDRKGWFREGRHGREVSVGDIWVEKVAPQEIDKTQDTAQEAGKENISYKMSAVINGEVISHEISKRQYEKFMNVDDYQRQRMMSRIFEEVDLKTRPEARSRFHLGAFLAAGLSAVQDVTGIGADIAHNIEHIRHPRSSPVIYQEAHGTGRIYSKPGVDSPQDIAERAFEAGLNAGIHSSGPRR